MNKLGSDAIDGEKQIAITDLTFGTIVKPADRKLDDNFPIAQFIDMKEDDLLGKPSFDRFESGFEVGQRDYLFGTAVAEKFDYEEVNLSSAPELTIIAGLGLFDAGHMAWALDNGAAGLNPNRLSDNIGIILNGGTFDYRGSSAANSSETVGPVFLSRGHSTIRVDHASAPAPARAELLASSLVRTPGATADDRTSARRWARARRP